MEAAASPAAAGHLVTRAGLPHLGPCAVSSIYPWQRDPVLRVDNPPAPRTQTICAVSGVTGTCADRQQCQHPGARRGDTASLHHISSPSRSSTLSCRHKSGIVYISSLSLSPFIMSYPMEFFTEKRIKISRCKDDEIWQSTNRYDV